MSKRRFYRFKAAPVKAPVKAAKDVKHKTNPTEDDKDQEKLDLEFYRLSRFSQVAPKKAAKAPVKQAKNSAAPAAPSNKSEKYTKDLVADLDISPEDDKLNTDFNRIMDMERFKQRSAHSHRHHK
jgi:hypothetical protein